MKNFTLTILDLDHPDPKRRFRVDGIQDDDPDERSPHAAWTKNASDDYTVLAEQSQGRNGFRIRQKNPGPPIRG